MLVDDRVCRPAEALARVDHRARERNGFPQVEAIARAGRDEGSQMQVRVVGPPRRPR
jgi:hypothetical protein